ncbi:MFS general substrate transporter [Thozetella sp. PMI_491]|nr:MFS general substrate transporter [Thozetella sp. PMI_491]
MSLHTDKMSIEQALEVFKMEKNSEATSSSDSDNFPDTESKQPDQPDTPPETLITDPPPNAPAGTLPDGGVAAWLQVAGGWVIMAATWGLINTYGVYQAYYQSEMLPSESASTISWIGSLQACLMLLLGPIAGPLFDAGYFRETLVVGLFLITFGMFMTSLCSTFWQVLLAQGICVGLGMGLTFLPSAAIQSQYFKKKLAFAVGVAGTGSPVGGIIFPIIFSRLEPRIGFGWATRVIAFILLGLSVVPVVFMRPRLPPPRRIRSLVDNSVWTDFSFMSFNIGIMLVFLVLYTAFFYIQVFDEVNHLSDLNFAPYTVTLLNVGSVFGRLLPMYLSDKWGVLNMTIFCTFASAVLAFGWMGIHNLAGVIVFAIIYGATSGAIVVGAPVSIMTLSPDMSRVGTRLGMVFAFASITVLVGTPIAGAIFGDFTRDRWLAGIGYSGAVLTLGTFMMILSWPGVRARKGTWRI